MEVTVAGALAAAADDRCSDTGSSTDLLQSQIPARHQGPLVYIAIVALQLRVM